MLEAGETDRQLLDQFVRDQDAGAFHRLVLRHGSAVHRVCRGVLNDPHEAEDVFQATFLVLARRAPDIQQPEGSRDGFAASLIASQCGRVDVLRGGERLRNCGQRCQGINPPRQRRMVLSNSGSSWLESWIGYPTITVGRSFSATSTG